MEKLTGSTCKSLMEAYAAVYDTARSKLEEEQINEFNDFINLLIDEGYDLSEYTYDELYEGWKEKVLKTTLKYGGKALEAGKGLAKSAWKGTSVQTPKGVKNIPGAEEAAKALLARTGNLAVKVGVPATVIGYGLDKATGGALSTLAQKGSQWGSVLQQKAQQAAQSVPSPGQSGQKPATAAEPSKRPKPEKPKEKTTSRLYEKAQPPLTVSGGRTGTGVGKKFKPRSWTQAEVQRYKKTRGAEQIKTDIQLNKDVAAMNRQTAATPPGRDPETYRPPSPTQRPPAATKPAPTRQAPTAASTQTGDKTKDTATWAKANPRLAQASTLRQQGAPRADINRVLYNKGTAAYGASGKSEMEKQAAELRGMQKASQERQAAQSGPMYSSPDVKSKMSSRTRTILGLQDSYDIVLDYLLSQGHVDTLEEALYVMMEMDSKCIQSIIENVSNEPKLKPGSGLGGGKPTYEKGKEPKPTGAQLPPV